MSGFADDLSSDQEEALRKLRTAVSDIKDVLPEDSDHFYLRWLRARKFKVDKAASCIRNHIEFRQRFEVDTIVQGWDPPEVLSKYIPRGFYGEDREGHPVWHCNIGNLDTRGLHRSAQKDDIIKFLAHYIETTIIQGLQRSSEKHGRHIETLTFVIDLEKLSFKKHFYWPGIVILREIFTILEANYPERIRRVFIVKSPKIFPVGYNLLKPFIDEHTREKIIVLGHNWQEELQKYISPDQLPQAYGGTRCEPDPYCTDHINHGGDIPQKYHLTNLTETNRNEMERVVVGRRGIYELEFQVRRPCTVLRWEFVTVDYDVSFDWYIKEVQRTKAKSSNTSNVVVPSRRVNSHIVPEVGVHECTCVGTYILKFDNTYCWTHTKEVFYSVKLFPPADSISEPLSHHLPVESPSLSPLNAAMMSWNAGAQQQDDTRTLYYTPCPSISPSSSKDEFFDCIQ